MQYHHGELKSAIVAEAIHVIEHEGVAQLSLRKIAKRLAVSQAAPYHHFKNKDEILLAAITHGFTLLVGSLQKEILRHDLPEKKLHKLGEVYVRFAVEHPRLFRLMQGPEYQKMGLNSDLDNIRRKNYMQLDEIIRGCLPLSNEVERKMAFAASWSIVHGLATLINDGRLDYLLTDHELDEVIAEVTRRIRLAVD